jgi:hypothetical protein
MRFRFLQSFAYAATKLSNTVNNTWVLTNELVNTQHCHSARDHIAIQQETNLSATSELYYADK